MTQDSYQSFASVYDDWQKLYPQPFSVALGPRIRAAVREYGSPAPVLGDLACGTGLFAWWWKRIHRSWTVYGCDRSPFMIRSARKARPGRVTPAPHFFVQDLTRTSLPQSAGVITCLFDSLNHVTRSSELQKAFSGVYESLLPGGLFLFDLIDEAAFPEVFSGSSILDGKDLYGGMEMEYTNIGGLGVGRARFTFFRRRGKGWTRLEFDLRERRWLDREVRRLLRRTGLQLVRLDRIDPYASKEFFVPRTFWICRRPE